PPGNAMPGRLCLPSSFKREAEPRPQCVPRRSLGTRSLSRCRFRAQWYRYERAHHFAIVRVIEAHQAVEAGGSDFLAVGPVGDRVHRSALAFEVGDELGVGALVDACFALAVTGGADQDAL